MATQIVIKRLEWEPPGIHSNMGSDYMVRIGKSTAKALCGIYPLPSMGHEVVVAVSDKCPYGFRSHLMLQNISGHFYAACCNAKVSDWPVTFRVTVLGV